MAKRAAINKGRIGLTLVIVLLLVVGLLSLKQPQQQTLDLTGVAFHSMAWHARIADAPAGLSQQQLQQGLQQALDEVDQALSSWRADSEVSKYNRLAANTPLITSARFYHALSQAQHISQLTDGAYDVSIAPLIDLWGFGPQGRPSKTPTAEQLRQVRDHVGWQHIQLLAPLDQQPYRVAKTKAIQINLSSLGEGTGVDAMRAWLQQHGIKNYMISVAGTMIVSGLNHDQPWRIAIERPDETAQIHKVLHLSNVIVSTSGAYRNYYELNGTRYSHTIDPNTGQPISHPTISVTYIRPLSDDPYAATFVDGVTTGLNVFGADKGIRFANQQPQPLAVLYIEKLNHQLVEKSSQAFHAYL